MDIKPMNVLLVEDDPATCRLVKKILSRKNNGFRYTVETAHSMANAIEFLHKKRFDNVLLDLNLPDSNSVDTVRRLCSLDPDIPVVVLTGSTDRETELLARKQGAEDYLIKGSDAWQFLTEHINNAIKRKKKLDELKARCEQFKSIVYSAPSAIVCISTRGQILEFNVEAQNLWNCTREEVLGKNFLELCVRHRDRFNLYADLRKAFSGQPIRDIQTIVTVSDGTEHLLQWNFSIVRHDEEEPIIVAVAHDITMTGHEAGLPTPKLIFNPNFNDTVDLVISSLESILEKLEGIQNLSDTTAINALANESNKTKYKIPSEKAAAIERLILSLLANERERNAK